MRPFDPGAGIAFAADGVTAACGVFNAAWLLAQRLRGVTTARRQGALALALLNIGVAVEALFALALFQARLFDIETAPFFSLGPWLAARAALLAGAAALSVLILRRMAR